MMYGFIPSNAVHGSKTMLERFENPVHGSKMLPWWKPSPEQKSFAVLSGMEPTLTTQHGSHLLYTVQHKLDGGEPLVGQEASVVL